VNNILEAWEYDRTCSAESTEFFIYAV